MSIGAEYVQQGGDGDGERSGRAQIRDHNLTGSRVEHQALELQSCMLSHHGAPKLSS